MSSNEDEYFNGGKIQIDGSEDVPVLLGVSKDEWEKLSNEEALEDYVFTEEYLAEFLKLFNLPDWANGVVYSYLNEDLDSFEFTDDIKVEKHAPSS